MWAEMLQDHLNNYAETLKMEQIKVWAIANTFQTMCTSHYIGSIKSVYNNWGRINNDVLWEHEIMKCIYGNGNPGVPVWKWDGIPVWFGSSV